MVGPYKYIIIIIVVHKMFKNFLLLIFMWQCKITSSKVSAAISL